MILQNRQGLYSAADTKRSAPTQGLIASSSQPQKQKLHVIKKIANDPQNRPALSAQPRP
jgi:hypothetical protein